MPGPRSGMMSFGNRASDRNPNAKLAQGTIAKITA
jgi:hypothetical protein